MTAAEMESAAKGLAAEALSRSPGPAKPHPEPIALMSREGPFMSEWLIEPAPGRLCLVRAEGPEGEDPEWSCRLYAEVWPVKWAEAGAPAPQAQGRPS